MFEDFKSNRVLASATPRQRKPSGSKEGLLNAPLEWLDDTLFGWSKSSKSHLLGSAGEGYNVRKSRSSSRVSSDAGSGYGTENEDTDYDAVLGMERDLAVQTQESRQRRKSYQDLKAARQADAPSSSSGAASTALEVETDGSGLRQR